MAIAPVIFVLGPAFLYLLGSAFDQGFLHEFGLNNGLFEQSFEQTLATGFIAFQRMVVQLVLATVSMSLLFFVVAWISELGCVKSWLLAREGGLPGGTAARQALATQRLYWLSSAGMLMFLLYLMSVVLLDAAATAGGGYARERIQSWREIKIAENRLDGRMDIHLPGDTRLSWRDADSTFTKTIADTSISGHIVRCSSSHCGVYTRGRILVVPREAFDMIRSTSVIAMDSLR